MQLFETELQATNAHVAAVMESWFHGNFLSYRTEISGFNTFRCDRSSRRGGGVCVFFKASLDSELIVNKQNTQNNFCHKHSWPYLTRYGHECLRVKICKHDSKD
jgi:hypothetical protein